MKQDIPRILTIPNIQRKKLVKTSEVVFVTPATVQ